MRLLLPIITVVWGLGWGVSFVLTSTTHMFLVFGLAGAAALVGAAAVALLGGSRRYLIAAWGMFVGLALTPFVEITSSAFLRPERHDWMPMIAIDAVFFGGLVMLALTLFATRRQRR